jgi:hypothetical protein
MVKDYLDNECITYYLVAYAEIAMSKNCERTEVVQFLYSYFCAVQQSLLLIQSQQTDSDIQLLDSILTSKIPHLWE